MNNASVQTRNRRFSQAGNALSWRGLVSRSLAVYLLTITCLTVAGAAIYEVVRARSPGLTEAAVASLLALDPETYLRPEPEERTTYVALLLLAPVLIGLFEVLLRRSSAFAARSGNLCIMLLIAVAAAISFPANEYDRLVLESVRTVSVAVSIPLALLLGSWIVLAGRIPGAIRIRGLRTATAFVLVAALALTALWRIFGAATVSSASFSYIHLDAFAYSPIQTSLGATCLFDVLPQYGCYGEFLSPLLHITGRSVLAMTSILAVLQFAALASVIVFARSLVRDPVMLIGCGLWLFIASNRIVMISHDPYAQYTPLRLLCPALSLLMAAYWPRSRGALTAGYFGIFAGLSCWWNLDSGVVVVIALGALIVFSGATGRRFWENGWRQNALYAGLYSAGVIGSAALFYVYLCAKAGAMIDLARYTVFQRVFVVSGFYMLPMPGLPDPWFGAIAVALAVLVWTAGRFRGQVPDWRLERAAYLSILALGGFSYFVGRSHPAVFELVSWPFAVLFFFAIDRMVWCRRAPAQWAGALTLRALAGVGVLVGGSFFAFAIPHSLPVSYSNWANLFENGHASELERNAAFIRGIVQPGQTAAIYARDQGFLYAAAGLRSAIPGPGLVETVRRVDADAVIDAIKANGPDHLFIGEHLVEGERQTWGSVPWIHDSLGLIEKHYRLAAWSPDNRIADFEKRNDVNEGPDLPAWPEHARRVLRDRGSARYEAVFDPAIGKLADRFGRRFQLPIDLPWKEHLDEFTIEMSLRLDRTQANPYATILSDHLGFRGFVIHHPPGAANRFVAIVGDGKSWIESEPFEIPAEQEVTLLVQCAAHHLLVSIDGRVVVSNLGPMAEAIVPITVGNWNNPGRELAGKVSEIRVYDFPVLAAPGATNLVP